MKRTLTHVLIVVAMIATCMATNAQAKGKSKQDARNPTSQISLTNPPLKAGDRVIFLGDSITFMGVQPDGYVTLFSKAMESKFLPGKVEVIGAGVGGNRVPDLLARLQHDVIDRKPTVVVVYIGINDVWHWDTNKGTTEADYRAGLSKLIQTIKANKARVLLCTPSVIGEKVDGTEYHDAMLDKYAQISREVARAEKVDLLDLRKYFKAYLKVKNVGNVSKGVLTTDSVHLNPTGNQFVATLMQQALTTGHLPEPADMRSLTK